MTSPFIRDALGHGARLLPQFQEQGSDSGPATRSCDYLEMEPLWCTINDVIAGGNTVRARGIKYLPAFVKESRSAYERRRCQAVWPPEFDDAFRSLTSAPFGKPVTLQGDVPSKIADFVTDVNGMGDNLTTFSKRVFEDGVAKGVTAILVDYPRMPNILNGRPLTLADERALGARPYFCHIKAEQILSLSTDRVGAREVITQVRIHECVTVRDGFKEHFVDRIRVLEPGRWTLYEYQEKEWVIVGEGVTSLPEVPLVLFFTGERSSTYKTKPPLIDIVELQLALYRAWDRYNCILDNASSPMLVGEGIVAPEQRRDADGAVIEADTIEVGPSQILFAPMNADGKFGTWKYIAPDPAAIAEARTGVESLAADLRRLAMQPTVQKTGGITATASAIDESKAHSAVESWAAILQDRLNEALAYVAQWLGLPDTVTCVVNTDFHNSAHGVDEAKLLTDAQKGHIISKKALVSEYSRRGILGPDFDPEADEQQLAEETQGLLPEEDIDPVSGNVINYRQAV